MNLESKRVNWLINHCGQIVKVQCGDFTYEGTLRYFQYGESWVVKFCEFSANDISSYGFDAELKPYVILIGE